jgi:hypothetical protein
VNPPAASSVRCQCGVEETGQRGDLGPVRTWPRVKAEFGTFQTEDVPCAGGIEDCDLRAELDAASADAPPALAAGVAAPAREAPS